MVNQIIVFGTLLAALVLFIQNKFRYDIVALFSLMAVVLAGIVSPEKAFEGFGHPAVITVAAVLIISRGLSEAGLVDILVQWLSKIGNNEMLQLAGLTGLVTIISAFMNNIGALALIMPVAIRMARQNHRSPSIFLMPLAFGSLLGGLTTLIGTPPNIIIATFRQEQSGVPFRMFDFAPVGIMVVAVACFFLLTLGRRLVPQRAGQASRDELFQIEAYTTEVLVTEDCSMVGNTIRELHSATEADIVIIGLARGDHGLVLPSSLDVIEIGDVLVIEADSKELQKFIATSKVEMVGSKKLCGRFLHTEPEIHDHIDPATLVCEELLNPDEMGLFEAVVTLGSTIVGRTVADINLRWRYGINLLAVARHGTRLTQRIKRTRFEAGDVLLLQGPAESVREALPQLGCFPLAERDYHLKQKRQTPLALVLFGIAILVVTLNILPIQIAFMLAAISFVVTGIISLRVAYESIDYPIVVLLGAMIPVGHALETTGAAATIASQLLHLAEAIPLFLTLTLLMTVTIILSNLINNAATAVIMAPIGIGMATGLGLSIDPFLMAVAIGSSTPFLTPIGHQSNTLVMGPGGYDFGDYWKLGLPITLLVIITSIPLIVWFWG